MTRDSQRARVYDADQLVRRVFDGADEHGVRELELFGSKITLPVERKFASVESIQTYVDAVQGLNWVKAQWDRASVPVTVRARGGERAAHYESSTATIAVPLHRGGTAWALREFVVLHELAHHLAPLDPELAPHGPEFVGRYVELVGEIVGAEAGLVLRTTMSECGVRIG